MIKTRKHITLSALSFIITAWLAGSVLSISCDDNNVTAKQQFDVALPSTETTTHKKRMRKPNEKKEKKKKIHTYMDMSYDELLVAKDAQKEKNNISVTIKYLDQLMKLCNNVSLLADHLLEVADLFFLDGQFEKAAQLYTQYCTLYPGSEKQEYALYRSIISSFSCILPVDRDQTKTEDTLALTEAFLQQDHFTSYKNEVITIQTQCYQQLATSECNICTFYLTRGKLTAAEKRLSKIRLHWLPKLPTIEPQIIALEAQLTEQKDMLLLLNEKHTQLAHNKKQKHMADRF